MIKPITANQIRVDQSLYHSKIKPEEEFYNKKELISIIKEKSSYLDNMDFILSELK